MESCWVVVYWSVDLQGRGNVEGEGWSVRGREMRRRWKFEYSMRDRFEKQLFYWVLTWSRKFMSLPVTLQVSCSRLGRCKGSSHAGLPPILLGKRCLKRSVFLIGGSAKPNNQSSSSSLSDSDSNGSFCAMYVWLVVINKTNFNWIGTLLMYHLQQYESQTSKQRINNKIILA